MAECEDDWADAPCLRPTFLSDDEAYRLNDWRCQRCFWWSWEHEPFYVRWWRRLTTLGTRGHGSA